MGKIKGDYNKTNNNFPFQFATKFLILSAPKLGSFVKRLPHYVGHITLLFLAYPMNRIDLTVIPMQGIYHREGTM